MLEEKLILLIVNNYINGENTIEIPTEIDYKRLFNIAKEQKIFPIVYNYVRIFIPKEIDQVYTSEYLFWRLDFLNKVSETKKILSVSKEDTIPIILIKGIVLSSWLYDNSYDRYFSDMDFIIYPNDILKMEKILTNMNYLKCFGLLDRREDEKFGVIYKDKLTNNKTSTIYNFIHDNHEVTYSKKIGPFKVDVELKRGTSSIPDPNNFENLLDSKIKTTISDIEVQTLNKTNTLIHLFSNTFENTENSLFITKSANLRDYLDIVLFLKKEQSQINWESFSEISNKLKLINKIEYIYNNLKKIFPKENLVNVPKIIKKHISNIESDNSTLSSGSLVEWPTSILDRLFKPRSELREEFFKLFKRRIHSKYNENFNNPTLLNTEHNFIDNKYNKYSFSYSFDLDDDIFRISFRLPTDLYNKLNNLCLIVTFLENGKNSHITYKNIFIRQREKRIVADLSHLNIYTDLAEESPCQEVQVEFNIDMVNLVLEYSFEELKINPHLTNGFLSYNIGLQEEVLPNYGQLIGTQYSQLHLGLLKVF
ncbi:nucleotidyltransferase family protein [Alkalibacterium sp. f15]|uniref:nucleotidyltransferase family protein n=1 Tax=Alkalibacterium sp. f15 TaxID=3414029 RepID=UPI003BF8CEB1